MINNSLPMAGYNTVKRNEEEGNAVQELKVFNGTIKVGKVYKNPEERYLIQITKIEAGDDGLNDDSFVHYERIDQEGNRSKDWSRAWYVDKYWLKKRETGTTQ
jgi:hypothetical protein